MPTIIVKVDLECCRCRAKIQKVLNRIKAKGEFCIDDIEYDEKKNRVVIKGPFDADKLADKLCCKACSIIKEIEIMESKKDKDEEKKKEESKVVKDEEKTKKNEKTKEVVKKTDDKPPATKVVEVPYPWPYPYPWPVSGACCCHHSHGGCGCCSCEAPPPQYIPVPQPCPPQPYRIVCEDDPAYACTIM